MDARGGRIGLGVSLLLPLLLLECVDAVDVDECLRCAGRTDSVEKDCSKGFGSRSRLVSAGAAATEAEASMAERQGTRKKKKQ